MKIAAIILLKSLHDGKRRLADALEDGERIQLVQTMFTDVLDVLRKSRDILSIRVLTRRPELMPHGIDCFTDSADDLNLSLRNAAAMLQSQGFEAMLVIPGDVPFVSTQDIEDLISHGNSERVVIVPDIHGSGTNALLLAPPLIMSPGFGANSFAIHLSKAATVGAKACVMHSARLALDIDVPADLAVLACEGAHQYDFLRQPHRARVGIERQSMASRR